MKSAQHESKKTAVTQPASNRCGQSLHRHRWLLFARAHSGVKMLGFSTYNYEHFSRDLFHDLAQSSFSGPVPGERAPDFKAVSLEGETIRLSDFGKKKNVLLIFGSATCPMTASTIGGINQLYDRFRGDDIEFLFIYVREAHPGEIIPAHRSMREKIEAARLLRYEEEMQ